MSTGENGWIERARQGDAGAFESLVERYQGRVTPQERAVLALEYNMGGNDCVEPEENPEPARREAT